MDPQYWHDKWEQDDIGFHEADANPNLVAHLHKVAPAAPARVFVPLCGKTRDIAWLLAQGYHVVGAELSQRAITDLFRDLGVAPQITQHGPLARMAAANVTIFVGDIFDVTSQDLGVVDVVYDRAALVALPHDIRGQYAAHVHALAKGAPQLLLCFEYEQSAMKGPPFSVDIAEINRVYGIHYAVTPLSRKAVSCPLKTRLRRSKLADQTAWHLAQQITVFKHESC